MTLVVITVAIALVFDFTNGFHDTANAVATSVSTRALSPRLAVAVAALANLGGAFVTTAVATTVGKGIIDTTLAIVRRETNSWKLPAAQFCYMTGLAYIAALATNQVLSRIF